MTTQNVPYFVATFGAVLLTFFILGHLFHMQTNMLHNSFQDASHLIKETRPLLCQTLDHYTNFTSVIEAQKELKRLATTATTECGGPLKKTRGPSSDYELCASDPYGPKKNNCLIYSFGIGHDSSFDDYMHEAFGCDVRMFDPTIHQETRIIKPNMYFYNLGVSGKDERMGPSGTWELNRVQTILKKLGHLERVIDIMKIDIEKYEWEVIRDVIETGHIYNVRQILVELHTPTHRNLMKMADYLKACNILHSLKQAGFEIFKYHNNNCCGGFSPLVNLPGARPVCCYESFYVNTKFNVSM